MVLSTKSLFLPPRLPEAHWSWYAGFWVVPNFVVNKTQEVHSFPYLHNAKGPYSGKEDIKIKEKIPEIHQADAVSKLKRKARNDHQLLTARLKGIQWKPLPQATLSRKYYFWLGLPVIENPEAQAWDLICCCCFTLPKPTEICKITRRKLILWGPRIRRLSRCRRNLSLWCPHSYPTQIRW